jgi:hypothetical protein
MKSDDAERGRTGNFLPDFRELGGAIHRGVVQDWGHARVEVWRRKLAVKFVQALEEKIKIRKASLPAWRCSFGSTS